MQKQVNAKAQTLRLGLNRHFDPHERNQNRCFRHASQAKLLQENAFAAGLCSGHRWQLNYRLLDLVNPHSHIAGSRKKKGKNPWPLQPFAKLLNPSWLHFWTLIHHIVMLTSCLCII